MPFLACGDQFVKSCLGLLRRQYGQSTSRPYQIAEREVMFTLVGDHLFEDGNAWLVTKLLDLLAVLCNIPSFIDFQPAKRQVCSTDAVRQRIRLPIRIPTELWLCPTEFLDASCPKIGVMLLSHRQTSQRIPTMRVRFTIRESGISVEALHLRLPVRLQSIEDVFVVESCHATLHAGRGILGIILSFQDKPPTSWGLFLFTVPRVDIEVA